MDGNHSPSPGDESAAQRQARIRRERREAKIKAGGSARLDKITSVSGRPAETAGASQPFLHATTNALADPDEVDISTPSYSHTHILKDAEASAEDEIRRLLRGPVDRTPPLDDGSSQFGMNVANDLFPNVLQQLMGGSTVMEGGRGQGGNRDQGGLPPGLAAMLGVDGPSQGEKQPSNKSKYMWNIAHAFGALALGVYMVFITAFDGAQFSRWDDNRAVKAEAGVRFFWAFVTAQLVLQSSRYYLERDRGALSGEGWMNMIAGIVPEPWRSRALLFSRYSVICSTVMQDAMVVVFVLGCMAWWEGAII